MITRNKENKYGVFMKLMSKLSAISWSAILSSVAVAAESGDGGARRPC